MRPSNFSNLYKQPARWSPWSAGLFGGAIGMLVMAAFWYTQTKAPRRLQLQSPQRPDLSRHGQAPARSHIQLLAHPARQQSTPGL